MYLHIKYAKTIFFLACNIYYLNFNTDDDEEVERKKSKNKKKTIGFILPLFGFVYFY